MNALAAQFGPRMRVLGDRAGYTKYGLDGQEAALHAGQRPGDDGWGEDPPAQWGTVGTEGDLREIRTEPGRYEAFYAGLVAALQEGAPLPVDPAESVAVLEILEAARRSAARARDRPPRTRERTASRDQRPTPILRSGKNAEKNHNLVTESLGSCRRVDPAATRSQPASGSPARRWTAQHRICSTHVDCRTLRWCT